jgi:hypothetical protein
MASRRLWVKYTGALKTDDEEEEAESDAERNAGERRKIGSSVEEDLS